MKAYVRPAILMEEPLMFETCHSDPFGGDDDRDFYRRWTYGRKRGRGGYWDD